MNTLTLCFLLAPEQICLAMKKRGFGSGYWNGYGGKCKPGEGLLETAAREVHEEARVVVNPRELERVGLFDFIYEDEGLMRVHAFVARTWEGEPQETAEMRPAWFSFTDIPYEKMWEDDQHWLPRVLAGEKLRGWVWFDESGFKIREMEWQPLGEGGQE